MYNIVEFVFNSSLLYLAKIPDSIKPIPCDIFKEIVN